MAIVIKTIPIDKGANLSTAIISGGVSEEILQATPTEEVAVTGLISLIRDGENTSMQAAAIAIENMSTTQRDALIDYMAAITAETDTSSVETAIGLL